MLNEYDFIWIWLYYELMFLKKKEAKISDKFCVHLLDSEKTVIFICGSKICRIFRSVIIY